jgi:hypothetical protein
MHSAFNQFAAFQQDAIDNKAFVQEGKLKMPVLAIGAEKSFGTAQKPCGPMEATLVRLSACVMRCARGCSCFAESQISRWRRQRCEAVDRAGAPADFADIRKHFDITARSRHVRFTPR